MLWLVALSQQSVYSGRCHTMIFESFCIFVFHICVHAIRYLILIIRSCHHHMGTRASLVTSHPLSLILIFNASLIGFFLAFFSSYRYQKSAFYFSQLSLLRASEVQNFYIV